MSTWNQFLAEEGIQLETRGYSSPDKVYIEGKNLEQEYSEFEPGGALTRSRIDDLLYGKYSQQNFIELFYSIPEVFAPVNEIARRVSDAVWELRKNSTDEVMYNDADFNRLFSQPNPLMGMRDFIYQAVCYEILTGKEVWHFNKVDVFSQNYKNIVNWWNLPAASTTAKMREKFDPYVTTDLKDFIEYFRVPLGHKDKKVDVDTTMAVVHWDLEHPMDFNKARPLIVGAEKAIRNLIPVYEARGIIYIKRGALGFLVSKKSDETGMQSLTKKEKKEATDDFNSTYGVQRGKAPIGITSVPLEFIRTAMSIQELQPFEETAADAAAIYSVLRVPAHLQPSKDKSTFSNADTDLKSFYTDVIIPWAKRYADIWTVGFGFERSYIQPNYSHISVLQINRKEESAVDKIQGSIWFERWTNSACTLNEWIVANKGFPGTGAIYEKKLLNLTPEEFAKVKELMNLKSKENASTEQPKVETKAKGTKA